ncbi:uncharacterized protein PV06_02654 [Exophiala oligosperma]|uniref:Uncharacterized protein n=1 Tax=Exophiala oligosperma TaxID=215243 RepID=A0A0D2CB31_9EURO|nr:uncharacterized protein PV06_02654 [Exophiala oligosperma]KIW47042.1 hypothetical protein PV06_02654 [Exophiala oligosperma]
MRPVRTTDTPVQWDAAQPGTASIAREARAGAVGAADVVGVDVASIFCGHVSISMTISIHADIDIDGTMASREPETRTV